MSLVPRGHNGVKTDIKSGISHLMVSFYEVVYIVLPRVIANSDSGLFGISCKFFRVNFAYKLVYVKHKICQKVEFYIIPNAVYNVIKTFIHSRLSALKRYRQIISANLKPIYGTYPFVGLLS